jgi:hypothetical protein
MSTGLDMPASAGRNSASWATVRSLRVGTSRPFDSSASAARMPDPPALVSTATLRPRGSPWLDSIVATSKSSSSVSVRITPACPNSAPTAVSPALIAAVWLEAARSPAPVPPDFTATIGFVREMRRAMRENLRGFPNDSRYIRMTSVSASSSQYSSRSLPEMSALFPTDTNVEMPSPSRSTCSSTARPSAPDCDDIDTRPGRGNVVENVVFIRTSPALPFIRPMQFGPTSRMPCARARASSSSWSAAPPSTSAKPAEMTQVAARRADRPPRRRR